MKIRVKYLMWLRDKIGVESEEYVFDREITLRELINLLKNKHVNLEKFLDRGFNVEDSIIIIVNGKSINQNLDYVLNNNDEVVLLPPVSGG
ncbi:MAG: MoaD/ThiS family protein [Desulfurococcaceae archaeon]|uniref:MoaD/ThiS family protein n=1 Tax=Staphylothermus marinus TaxID=2280 RepID=A0A7C4H8G8_STAMA